MSAQPPPATVRLVPFGLPDLPLPHASPDVLAELHTVLLPTSPAVYMGPHFLRDFYYRVLPDEGLVVGYVALVDDAPVGFLAGTRDAHGFLTVAFRRRWRTLAAVLLRHPPSPRAVRKALQVGGDRHRHRADRASELLSLGVRPAGQRGEASGPSRRLLAQMLIDATCQHLPLPIIALVDETNGPSRRMFVDLGWVVSGRVTVGWPVPQLVYRWDGLRATADG